MKTIPTFPKRRLAGQVALALACALSHGMAPAQTPPDVGSQDFESSTARFQATFASQLKPAMHAAYSGQNSLKAAQEYSYTATATAYLGFRPWSGGELYLNPEVTQGNPFSGLSGTGTFTNGELTRTASASPTFYRQRLFLRQTWGLGGGDEKVDADLNQMAGLVDRNRVVLTAGNFSLLDVFDDNAYAKDPRVHFMNAGFMGPLANDYAADARGFGWGFTTEWYQDGWALRIGRMTGPRTPNMLDIDYRIFKHYGDQVEVERAHELNGLPGKVRVLAWRNRAELARFSDALAWLQSHPGGDPQAIFAVRNGARIKSGYGVNIEQALADDLGWFLRAMQADGKTETWAFTEADGSFSTGLVLTGDRWQRHEDTLGLGYIRNTISAERRRYLQAGGISFFLGDGALNYRPEQVLELYYSVQAWKRLFVTADVQRMWNPGYNVDRGPANFFAVRLHAEF